MNDKLEYSFDEIGYSSLYSEVKERVDKISSFGINMEEFYSLLSDIDLDLEKKKEDKVQIKCNL